MHWRDRYRTNHSSWMWKVPEVCAPKQLRASACQWRTREEDFLKALILNWTLRTKQKLFGQKLEERERHAKGTEWKIMVKWSGCIGTLELLAIKWGAGSGQGWGWRNMEEAGHRGSQMPCRDEGVICGLTRVGLTSLTVVWRMDFKSAQLKAREVSRLKKQMNLS